MRKNRVHKNKLIKQFNTFYIMKTKRTTNAIGLKVKFIPATNEKGNFFRITQTTTKKVF